MKRLTFTVPGDPKSLKRHQTVPLLKCNTCGHKCQGQRQGCPKCGGTLTFLTNIGYDPAENAMYKNLAALFARQAMTEQKVDMFTGGALGVECDFYFLIPPSRKKLREGEWHCQRPDVDNLKKMALDALIKLIYADDCIIATIKATKRWTKNNPRAEITIYELGEPSVESKSQ